MPNGFGGPGLGSIPTNNSFTRSVSRVFRDLDLILVTFLLVPTCLEFLPTLLSSRLLFGSALEQDASTFGCMFCLGIMFS